MATETKAPVPAPGCTYIRPSIAEGILVVLMSLTAAAALDHMFHNAPQLEGPKLIWQSISADLSRSVLLGGQLAVFFFTAFRFYLGSLRFHQARQHYEKLFRLVFDLIGNTISFVGLYLCALTIQSTTSFYLYMAALHFLDLFWFFGAWLFSRQMGESLQNVIRRFILYDILTLFIFAVSFGVTFKVFHGNYGWPFGFQWVCLLTLLVFGVIDFVQNSSLYKGQALHVA